MPESPLLFAFVAAALVVLIIPGPGVLYIIARTLCQGRRAGLVSVLGLSVGALAHVVAAAVGLTAVLLSSATAFGIVKILGAAYLIYLGLRTIFSHQHTVELEAPVPHSMTRLFTDGVIVSVLNPKIAVFFLAFLPQFVEPHHETALQQIFLLGLLYVVLALFTDGTYALLASGLRRLGSRILSGPLPRYASGIVYIGLGVSTALADRKH